MLRGSNKRERTDVIASGRALGVVGLGQMEVYEGSARSSAGTYYRSKVFARRRRARIFSLSVCALLLFPTRHVYIDE